MLVGDGGPGKGGGRAYMATTQAGSYNELTALPIQQHPTKRKTTTANNSLFEHERIEKEVNIQKNNHQPVFQNVIM
jgi:hypothetical protein